MLMHHSGILEPLESLFVFASPCSRLERLVYELLVLLCKLRGDVVPEEAQFGEKVRILGVLGKILVVCPEDGLLDLSGFAEITRLRKHLDRLWHSADEVVRLQEFGQGYVLDFYHLVIALVNRLQISFIAGRQEEFPEGQRAYVHEVHLPDGEGRLVPFLAVGVVATVVAVVVAAVFALVLLSLAVQGEAEKRSCRHDGKTRRPFAEELKARKGSGRFLDFVKYEERLAFYDFLACRKPYGFDDRAGVYVDACELFAKEVVVHEVHKDGIARIVPPCELFHEPGLADLPCSHENQRLAVVAFFPLGHRS